MTRTTKSKFKPDDFDYDLPEELIAQRPVEPRDSSRLMVVDRRAGTISHHTFRDLPEFLAPEDALILNDTRVMPARLVGTRVPSGGRAELLLLHRHSDDTWEALVRPGRRLRPGARIEFGEGRLVGEVLQSTESGGRLIRFRWEGDFEALLKSLGETPLPPYIKEAVSSDERYQTVYANELGSAAAPTAGLHFTPGLLEQVRTRGTSLASVTLHVGLGTFRPVQADTLEDHTMHAEYYRVSPEVAACVEDVRQKGGRVVAVGTTVARVLESLANDERQIVPGEGWTDIFIYPGHTFRCLDALVTNFHLPRSTLLMLVSAFAGHEIIKEAYGQAVKMGYRFFSFGDAMLIV